MGFMRRVLAYLGNLFVALAVIYLGLAIYYWLGWPQWVRNYGSVAFVLAMALFWFLPAGAGWARRLGVLSCMAILTIAYVSKTPVEQNWVPLHERHVSAVIDGDIARLDNFRDAIHRVNEPSTPRWTQRTLDLSQLRSAELILQPFGDFRALEHLMLSFGFSDGRHVVISMEARRTSWASFDTLAGFFRHDQIYPIIGSERDLVWKRIARDPPFEMQFYPLAAEPAAIRAYFVRALKFANQVKERPQFYSTIRESCMTTVIKLAPQTFAAVPWYDIRKWIPGYSLSLFQDLGLVDDSLPADELARLRKLRSGIRDPADFPDDPAWSAYLRQP